MSSATPSAPVRVFPTTRPSNLHHLRSCSRGQRDTNAESDSSPYLLRPAVAICPVTSFSASTGTLSKASKASKAIKASASALLTPACAELQLQRMGQGYKYRVLPRYYTRTSPRRPNATPPTAAKVSAAPTVPACLSVVYSTDEYICVIYNLPRYVTEEVIFTSGQKAACRPRRPLRPRPRPLPIPIPTCDL